jgi:hypothetical protein
MAWPSEPGEQAEEEWQSRIAQKRLDLSASVQETLLQPVQATGEITAPVQNKSGLARRTTKVRLQVVPKTEGIHGTEEFIAPSPALPANPGLPAATKKSAETEVAQPHVEMSGSATFESGQGEVAVANVHVTASSVVAVMLAGDPGPVVVQYVSLRPKTGFTVHLSAPAKNRTPFNYTII